jgi:hypothetical protein
MPAQSLSSVSTRKIRVENISWELLSDMGVEPDDNHRAERYIVGELQAEFLLSLLTPPQQEVAKLLATVVRIALPAGFAFLGEASIDSF